MRVWFVVTGAHERLLEFNPPARTLQSQCDGLLISPMRPPELIMLIMTDCIYALPQNSSCPAMQRRVIIQCICVNRHSVDSTE